MKKILHLITGLEHGGGAEKALLATVPYLQYTENRVCVLRGSGPIGQKLEQLGIEVHYLKMRHWFDWGAIRRYRSFIKSYQPEVQVNYLIHADLFGRIFAKLFGVKRLVSYIRNRHIKPLFIILDRLTLGRVDYLLTNSQAVLKHYREQYRFAKEYSSCIPNGVELPSVVVDQVALRASLGLTQSDFVIICVARLHPQKDHPTLLKAVQILQDDLHTDVQLLICGDGQEKHNLILLGKSLGISTSLHFLGLRNDVNQLLALANLFVLPSLHEGMSNALLEAMAMGKVCLVSDIEENQELIQDSVTGFSFQVGDSRNLAVKLKFIHQQTQSEVKKIEQSALRVVQQAYSIKQVRKQLDLFLKCF